jgi:hypothetical protein
MYLKGNTLSYVRMVKSRMLNYIVLQCGHHYLSMFLTISQPPDLTTEPATWHFNILEFKVATYGERFKGFIKDVLRVFKASN